MRKVAVYAGTRNLYEVMRTAVNSLLNNTVMDRVYILTEDDDFPYHVPRNVSVINVSNQTYFPETGANYKSKWTYMAMIRVALAKMLPEENLVLWLDCDTIVDDDISELFSMCMDGYYFAGVKEFRKDNYINTGVLLMNLDKIRRDGIDDRIIEMLNTKKLECPDQDAINAVAEGRIMFLESGYNVCPFTEPPEHMKIYHYAAREIFDNDPLYRKYSGNETPVRTLIAVPCFDMVHADFMRCLVQMDKDENTTLAVLKNSLIYNARNTIAQNAIRYGFDRVLWLDSDITFEKDLLERLSEDMDKGLDYVSGVYVMRVPDGKPVVYSDIWYKIEHNEASSGATNVLDVTDGLFEIAGSGFGCVMTSVSLLKRMVEKYGAPFTPMMGLGEDLAFCWRVKQNGGKMYCDGRIRCGHIGQNVYGVEE